jgi:hypothetical protein
MQLPLEHIAATEKVPHSGGVNQDDSLLLFGNSFDSYELRDTFDRNPPQVPHSPLTRQSSFRHGIDIALSDLKQDAGSDYSLGDISPIKLAYSDSHQQEAPMMNAVERSPYEGTMWMNRQDESAVHNASISNPFYVLRSFRRVFEVCGCKYLLVPGAALCPVNMSDYSAIRHYKGPTGGDTEAGPSIELKLAFRRVQAALCAFGGMARPQRLPHPQHPGSIFRQKDTSALVERRMLYAHRLPGRYFLTGNRLSWEFEENPPVTIPSERQENDRMAQLTPNRGVNSSPQWFPTRGSPFYGLTTPHHNGMTPPPNNSGSPSFASAPSEGTNKMKYRCKLCGQLKNNHNCPYRQPLQRSIGVMVYPAVNSFTSFEPGTIAPPLTKMNNFVSYDSDQGSPEPEHSTRKWSQKTSAVTPDSLGGAASGSFFHSPQSSLSAHSAEEGQHGTATVSHHARAVPVPVDTRTGKMSIQAPRKRSHVVIEKNQIKHVTSAKRALFVATVALRPEHYRAVTPSSKGSNGEEVQESPMAYQYPPVPLTFAERKRLSDTLFYLSKNIPNMTADCAALLREARSNDEWDQAVAELLTQVVVATCCHEGDVRFEGIQQYLLGMGVSC